MRLLAFCCAFNAAAGQDVFLSSRFALGFVRIQRQSAIAKGSHTTQKSANDCEAKCTGNCLQYTWNEKSGHCFLSDSDEWQPTASNHTLSGCLPSTVAGCPNGPGPTPPAPMPPGNVPAWTAGTPDRDKYLGGFPQLPGVQLIELAHADLEIGTYNHAAMIDYFDGRFLVAWKNGPTTEDKAGQRILYSQSVDGKTWTQSDGTNILFPDMTTMEGHVSGKGTAALFVGPPIVINGRQYVGASPGQPAGASNGAQFCLWPDSISPRNTVGDKPETDGTLLMRQVLPGLGNFGPIFWAEKSVSSLWANASEKLRIKLLADMDAQTQADIATLRTNLPTLPCDPKSGTLKCEACLGGCALYSELPKDLTSNTRHERTHYRVPNDTADIILWRSYVEPWLYASVRANESAGQEAWSLPVKTTIPNDKTNLNAGPLPDGRVYLLNNPVDGSANALAYRDPITLATSRDGWIFDSARSVVSCAALTGSNETCRPRWCDGAPNSDAQASCNGKNPGPSYPQGLTVVEPAPEELQGFYVVASLNKEDIWVARVPFENF